MKLLLSCPNGPYSLIGYDYDKGKVFWKLPKEMFNVCSIMYHKNELWTSSHSNIRKIGERITTYKINGEYNSLAHSIRLIGSRIGVVDTGNSSIGTFNEDGTNPSMCAPFSYWNLYPRDCVHLNDICVTPKGVLATMFEYRPWRKLQKEIGTKEWYSKNMALCINLSDYGRIVGCGLNHPHSMEYVDDRLYMCFGGKGQFVQYKFDETGTLVRTNIWKITDEHFLRGSLYQDSNWYLGCSTIRHHVNIPEKYKDKVTRLAKICKFRDGKMEFKTITDDAEIYDILPWQDSIMNPIIDRHFKEIPCE